MSIMLHYFDVNKTCLLYHSKYFVNKITCPCLVDEGGSFKMDDKIGPEEVLESVR